MQQNHNHSTRFKPCAMIINE